MSAQRLPLRPFSRGEVWGQTASEASAFDARAIETVGVPQPVLMENAGRSAALVLHHLYPGASVLGLVGAGNNGGDALVALRSLVAWGHEVRAVVVADRPGEDPLAHGWEIEASSDDEMSEGDWERVMARADVVIDGVLGTGAKGAPRARQAAVIERLNAAELTVLALDVPSGIDASTGSVAGAAVSADVTVSFGAPKLGALVHPARALVGRHLCVEIGFPPIGAGDASARIFTPDHARSHFPARGTDTHKNRVGRVLIVGGSVGMAGAVILAARAAFHAGAGLVRVCSAPENRESIQSAIPEAIHLSTNEEAALAEALANSDAVAVGPGLGVDPGAHAALAQVVDGPASALLLDADALNLASAGAIDLVEVAANRPLLLTPHPGEMARLLGEGSVEDPATTVSTAARRFGCAVLLKGAPSLVAVPEQAIRVDTQSSSDLAVAGMGDTLAGVCVALMAQGLDAADAGSVGLFLSGRAAALADRGPGLTPSDVADHLPAALTEDARSETDLPFPFVIYDADAAR